MFIWKNDIIISMEKEYEIMYDTREENSMTIRSIAAWIIALTMVLSFVSFQEQKKKAARRRQ